MSESKGYYAVRYLSHVQVKDRKHAFTLGRHATWVDAEDARLATPVAELLEVVERGGS